MKHIFLKSLIIFGFIALSSGCTKDFDEINSNPNAPTAVNSGLLLPQIQRDMMNSVLGVSLTFRAGAPAIVMLPSGKEWFTTLFAPMAVLGPFTMSPKILAPGPT